MEEALFQINDDGELDINKIECYQIAEFKKLITRDNGSKIKMKGDYDGRHKLKAKAELMYIYMIHSPVSIIKNLPEQERREQAKHLAGLPEEWKPDKHIKAAEEKFISLLLYTGTYYSLVAASRSLYSISKDLDLLYLHKDKLKDKLKSVQDQLLNMDEEDEDYHNIQEKENRLVDRLISLNNKIQGIASKLPEGVEVIEKLKKEVAKELEKKSNLRGGGELGNREQ